MSTSINNNPVTNLQTAANLTSGSGVSAASASPNITAPGQSGGFNYTVGNGSGAVNVVYAFTGTVTAGTPFTINLSTGADQFGNTLGMVHVNRVHVMNQDVVTSPTHTLVVGGGTHPIAGTDQATVEPQGNTVTDNPSPGIALVGGTNDTLTLTASAGTIPFSVIVFGRNL